MHEKFIKKLKEDKDFYFGWQSNIAMAFVDEYDKDKKPYKKKMDIHKIANQASKIFLNRFMEG